MSPRDHQSTTGKSRNLDEAQAAGPTVGIVGASGTTLTSLSESFPAQALASTEELRNFLGSEDVAVVVFTESVAPTDAAAMMQACGEESAHARTAYIVMCSGNDLSLFQEHVDSGALFYLSPEPMWSEDLCALVAAAIERHQGTSEVASTGASRAEAAREVLSYSRKVGRQNNIDSAARVAANVVSELLGAHWTDCLLYDKSRDLLRSRASGSSSLREESAAAGLVSFVARTGKSLRVSHANGDARFDAEADTPHGTGDERFAAVAITNASEEVLAVLVALRSETSPEFGTDEMEVFELFASQVASGMSQLLLQSQVDSLLVSGNSGAAVHALFREAALEHRNAGLGADGEVLRDAPLWLPRAYALMALVFVVGVLYLCTGTVHEYAEGPAAVEVTGRTDVTARAASTVYSLEVEPGDKVAAGQVLVSLYNSAEASALLRLEAEIEQQVAARLLDPSDDQVAARLRGLYAEHELATARLSEKQLRAPHAGVVTDIRSRPGQRLEPGDVALTVEKEERSYSLVAVVPGHYRPQLAPGMQLRLELEGYEHVYETVEILSVGDGVVGPDEAARYLSADLADVVELTGPVVFVHAKLNSGSFSYRGNALELHDGMRGRVEVAIREQPIIYSLIPGLDALTSHD